MRRFARNPRRFDLLDLFGAVGQELKMSLVDRAYEDTFKAVIESELNRQRHDNKYWFGKRTEEMFGYIVAGRLQKPLVESALA